MVIIAIYPYNADQGHGTICSFKFLDDNVPHLSIRPYNACGDYNDDNDDDDNDYNDDNYDNDGTLIFISLYVNVVDPSLSVMANFVEKCHQLHCQFSFGKCYYCQFP